MQTRLLPTIATTSTSHNIRKLSNLAKIYINKVKYIGRNDSFIFKLVIFHNIFAKTNVPLEVKIKGFLIMLKKLVLDYYYSNIMYQ